MGCLAFYAATSLWIVATGWVRIFVGDGRIVGELTLHSLPAALAGSLITTSAYIALVVTAQVLQQLAFFGAAAILVWRRSTEVVVFVVAVFLLTDQAAVFPPEILATRKVETLRAIRAVASGEAIFSPAIARRLMTFFAPAPASCLN